jgi:hypothetical protein
VFRLRPFGVSASARGIAVLSLQVITVNRRHCPIRALALRPRRRACPRRKRAPSRAGRAERGAGRGAVHSAIGPASLGAGPPPRAARRPTA